eukprot:2131150-Pyramimonas_sp.AAC.1
MDLESGRRKTRVSRNSGLPIFFVERALDFDGPVFVGCLQREPASNFRLGLVIFTIAPVRPTRIPRTRVLRLP